MSSPKAGAAALTVPPAAISKSIKTLEASLKEERERRVHLQEKLAEHDDVK